MQINELRAQFRALDATQQKLFIENLRAKIQGTYNAEYVNFLNECISYYNSAVTGAQPEVCNVVEAKPETPSRNLYLEYMLNRKQVDAISLILAIVGLALVAPGVSLLIRGGILLFIQGFFDSISLYMVNLWLDTTALITSILAIVLSRRRASSKKTIAAFIMGIIGLCFLLLGFLFFLVFGAF